jgi:integrase
VIQTPSPADAERRPVSFPAWKAALARSGLPPGEQASHRRAVLTFLKHCKDRHAPATIALARQFLEATAATDSVRAGLRWFFHAARGDCRALPPARAVATAPARPVPRPPGRMDRPPPAARDLGGAEWERALIAACRQAGFLWRTEETYRGWAARFARFLTPRSPSAATGEDVSAFLSALAVERRAAPSTQKQALNALVFLMQEALHREVGELRYRRPPPQRRIPTVLAKAECLALFGALEGTSRLMAELMYGSGLRLMELVRLRVQDVDLERRQLIVRAGKGDRVNGFANAVT